MTTTPGCGPGPSASAMYPPPMSSRALISRVCIFWFGLSEIVAAAEDRRRRRYPLMVRQVVWRGPVAQLGARQTGSLKVRGSNPLGSTNLDALRASIQELPRQRAATVDCRTAISGLRIKCFVAWPLVRTSLAISRPIASIGCFTLDNGGLGPGAQGALPTPQLAPPARAPRPRAPQTPPHP